MKQNQVEIKKAGIEAIESIRDLAFKIWPNTYKNIISITQIDFMLEMMYSSLSIKKQMEEGCQFLMIYENGSEVGFASYQIFETQAKLHKIYILENCQGKGYGKAMVHEIIECLKNENVNTLTLNVNRNNTAKLAYEKMGFRVEKEEDIEIGNGFFMNDYVMKIDF